MGIAFIKKKKAFSWKYKSWFQFEIKIFQQVVVYIGICSLIYTVYASQTLISRGLRYFKDPLKSPSVFFFLKKCQMIVYFTQSTIYK